MRGALELLRYGHLPAPAEAPTSLVGRTELEHELRSALAEDRPEVYYQPLIRLADEAVVGLEALFRWEHPRWGAMRAQSVMELAEESDLIGLVGNWVLRRACRQVAEWRRSIPGLHDVRLWVNVSPAHFAHRDVVRDVVEALRAAGLPPGNLGIEITETLFLDGTPRVRETFDALRALGVAIAIDDFGTGYSSLGALKRFPADVLKVDGSFVKGLGHAPDTAIVAAFIALGAAMGLTVVAESVETTAQVRQLSEMGCAWAQGFHFSSALPTPAAEAFLRSSFGASDVPVPAAEGSLPALTLVISERSAAAV